MTIKVKDSILDGNLSQQDIDQQLQFQTETANYSYRQTKHNDKLAHLQREIAKIDELKQQLRLQQEYVAQLNAEIDQDYAQSIQEQNTREAMMTIDKDSKPRRIFPESKKEIRKQQEANTGRKIIGFTVDASGRTLKRIPIYSDSEPTKKSLGRVLKDGQWIDV